MGNLERGVLGFLKKLRYSQGKIGRRNSLEDLDEDTPLQLKGGREIFLSSQWGQGGGMQGNEKSLRTYREVLNKGLNLAGRCRKHLPNFTLKGGKTTKKNVGFEYSDCCSYPRKEKT